jgi:hypothetical protein
MTDIPSPFDLATAALRALGIVLARLPGEYRVNFRNGAESTARTVETLDQALAAGRAMAAERAEQQPNRGGPRRRPPSISATEPNLGRRHYGPSSRARTLGSKSPMTP